MFFFNRSIAGLVFATGLFIFASSVSAEESNAADVLFDTIDRNCIPQIENSSALDSTNLTEVLALQQFQIFRFMSRILKPEDVTLWQTSSKQVVIVEDNENRSCFILAFEIEEPALLDAYRKWRVRHADEILVFSDIETQSDFQIRSGRHGTLAKLLDGKYHLEVNISSHYKNNNFVTVFVGRYDPNPISDRLFGPIQADLEADND